MLPRHNRIPKSDFKKIFKEGRYLHSNNLILLYYRNNSIEEPQFAAIIKSKVTGAVGRNRIKRMIKRLLKKHLYSIKSDYQIIFMVKNDLKDTRVNSLEEEIKYLFDKANLCKDK